MSDLFTFYTETAGAAGALPLMTQRATNTPDHIELDMGMVAKIREIQIEGIESGTGKVELQYCLNLGATVEEWVPFKGFSKLKGDKPERWKFPYPLIVEAWNNTTGIRVYETAEGTTYAVGLQVTVLVGFDQMEKQ